MSKLFPGQIIMSTQQPTQQALSQAPGSPQSETDDLSCRQPADLIDSQQQKKYRTGTFFGMEHVQDTHRLALMNLMLHGIESDSKAGGIHYGDTLSPEGEGIACSSTDVGARERVVNELKSALLRVCPDEFVEPPPLVSDLVRAGGILLLIVPIDLQAPKGRLILPQVSTIRDALDADAATVVVKERETAHMLGLLNQKPDLVVCDSQVVLKMTADTPTDVPCTTFSILFARLKGDLGKLAAGAAAVDSLRAGARVLIAESCSHHAAEDDIGRVKIPRWLRQYTGLPLEIDVYAGRDFPKNLSSYDLVVQCGGCMHNRREVLSRIAACEAAGVPMTNYGLCISQTQGVLERVLSPFPAALDAYREASGRG